MQAGITLSLGVLALLAGCAAATPQQPAGDPHAAHAASAKQTSGKPGCDMHQRMAEAKTAEERSALKKQHHEAMRAEPGAHCAAPAKP